MHIIKGLHKTHNNILWKEMSISCATQILCRDVLRNICKVCTHGNEYKPEIWMDWKGDQTAFGDYFCVSPYNFPGKIWSTQTVNMLGV